MRIIHLQCLRDTLLFSYIICINRLHLSNGKIELFCEPDATVSMSSVDYYHVIYEYVVCTAARKINKCPRVVFQ